MVRGYKGIMNKIGIDWSMNGEWIGVEFEIGNKVGNLILL